MPLCLSSWIPRKQLKLQGPPRALLLSLCITSLESLSMVLMPPSQPTPNARGNPISNVASSSPPPPLCPCRRTLSEDEEGSGDGWIVRDITGLCEAGRVYASFGQAVVRDGLLAVVAQLHTGQEGIYTMDVRTSSGNDNSSPPGAGRDPGLDPAGLDPAGLGRVVAAGDDAPGGGVFASFPQPPSVSNGSLLFRAYLTTGDTGRDIPLGSQGQGKGGGQAGSGPIVDTEGEHYRGLCRP